MEITATHVVYAFALFFGLKFAIERALSVMNLNYTLDRRTLVPEALKDHITADTREKSVQYTETNTQFGHVSAAVGALITVGTLFSGLMPWLDGALKTLALGELTHGVAFILSLSMITGLFGIPLAIYSTFWIEQRFGFNTTTPRMFVMDMVKGLAVGLAVGVPLLYGLFMFMAWTGPFWWVWATAFMIGFQVVMVFAYPILIAPLFNKFTPLKDPERKAAIEALAKKCGFPIGGIYVMDGSTRSKHSNAYFTGFGSFRRIVLYDTLLNELTVDELCAVLAHEIGHCKRNHILKGFFLSTAFTLANFYLMSLLLNWQPMYEAFGFSQPSLAVGLLLFSMLTGPFMFWIEPLTNWLSRKHEYEADAYAKEHVGEEPMKGALVKLNEQNLSNATPHPLYSAYHYSHPALLERLEGLSRA